MNDKVTVSVQDQSINHVGHLSCQKISKAKHPNGGTQSY